jgi:hypothetical protein
MRASRTTSRYRAWDRSGAVTGGRCLTMRGRTMTAIVQASTVSRSPQDRAYECDVFRRYQQSHH